LANTLALLFFILLPGASLTSDAVHLPQVAANGDLANWIIPGKMVKVPMAGDCLKMVLHTLIQLSCPDHVVAIPIKLLMSSLLQYILIGPILPTLSSLMGIMTTLEVWNDSRTKISGKV